jgi:gamma-glutamyl:cysteine ligase YbdK (ATP-grasp superfamily)
MTAKLTLPAFAAYGIELEYAIVDAQSLDVRPSADALLRTFAGHGVAGVERDGIGWSNELVAHVAEVKNVAPTPRLDALAVAFQRDIGAANEALAALNARLMPTGMHPWMSPRAETVVWPHEGAEIYRAFDRIFDCRRHGWANIQAMHVNLPFAGDGEFARLHAAVRLLLPLIPALAASSPFRDGEPTGLLDSRLDAYCGHAAAVPAVSGEVIPDTIESRADYETRILEPIYRQIAPHDRDGLLQHEWLNARGAIARFDRDALEVRLADTQECPQADLAVAAALAAVARMLYRETGSSLAQQQAVPTATLRATLAACIRDADDARVDDPMLLAALGLRGERRAAAIWERLLDASATDDAWWRPDVAYTLERGTLARRILRATGPTPTRATLADVYRRLCECLASGTRFE